MAYVAITKTCAALCGGTYTRVLVTTSAELPNLLSMGWKRMTNEPTLPAPLPVRDTADWDQVPF